MTATQVLRIRQRFMNGFAPSDILRNQHSRSGLFFNRDRETLGRREFPRCAFFPDGDLLRREILKFLSLFVCKAVLATLWLGATIVSARAETMEIFPSESATCDEEMVAVFNQLKPGDELIFHDGAYAQPCRRALQINGLPGRPIIIRAAANARPVITRSAGSHTTENNLEIVDSSYVVIRGLHFRGGSIGIRIIASRHITIEDCEISETQNNAIAANRGNSEALIMRRNHIHHTGLYRDSPTEGEGMYIGCHDGSCRVTHSLFENNYIHHLRGTSSGGNDGIEIKVGSYGNTIRDNVIHDTNIGTKYPCIFVYGGGKETNVVEGNVVWNCGEGIQVVADAVIRNNIIANSSSSGITLGPHAANTWAFNVSIINNTIVGHPACIRMRGERTAKIVLANNALYCPAGAAIDAAGVEDSGVEFRANFIEGLVIGVKFRQGQFIPGGNIGSIFTNPGELDFWPRPKSPLVAAADFKLAPRLDFNNTKRGPSLTDVGAYDTRKRTSNPGWKIVAGFKKR